MSENWGGALEGFLHRAHQQFLGVASQLQGDGDGSAAIATGYAEVVGTAHTLTYSGGAIAVPVGVVLRLINAEAQWADVEIVDAEDVRTGLPVSGFIEAGSLRPLEAAPGDPGVLGGDA